LASYPELAGRTAVVTGAVRGIGWEVARSLVDQGCRVAFVDLAPLPELSEACRRADGTGHLARPYVCDIRSHPEVDGVIETVITDFGGLHILVNNAGITADGVLWKLSDKQWHDVVDTNLTGTFNMIRAASERLRKQRFGRIVNISSINALRGKFGQANYSASKAGVLGLTFSAARELARERITVNTIAPGFIETEMTAHLPEPVVTQAREESLFGRLGRPSDIASAVLFLCSDGAEQITGIVLRVDGGQCL
jgi:3-oxoacyl-[acyl-carrier protein] reductase